MCRSSTSRASLTSCCWEPAWSMAMLRSSTIFLTAAVSALKGRMLQPWTRDNCSTREATRSSRGSLMLSTWWKPPDSLDLCLSSSSPKRKEHSWSSRGKTSSKLHPPSPTPTITLMTLSNFLTAGKIWSSLDKLSRSRDNLTSTEVES